MQQPSDENHAGSCNSDLFDELDKKLSVGQEEPSHFKAKRTVPEQHLDPSPEKPVKSNWTSMCAFVTVTFLVGSVIGLLLLAMDTRAKLDEQKTKLVARANRDKIYLENLNKQLRVDLLERIDSDKAYLEGEIATGSERVSNLNELFWDDHLSLLRLQFGSADVEKCTASGGISSEQFNKCYFLLKTDGFSGPVTLNRKLFLPLQFLNGQSIFNATT
ncbi:uncharacterized protein LOC142338164 [Convolutriloba macropyga]|uniref:uncharacterized protein LOC142338164 n=1 Tax=Convolutriloba macropyga TaxID=536237 RepID=UPI003F5204CA